ncbi:unnamed protein product, partial [Coregonus sp. 'balchen']
PDSSVPLSTDPLCPPSSFACASGECIDEGKVCDFTPHCPGGEDEGSCRSFCDFESNSCGWHEYGFVQGDGFDWVRGSAMTVPLDHQGQIPPLDHSTNSSQGNRWNRVTVQLGRITQPFQFSLAKLSLGVFDGVSALDDISFQNCSLPPAVEAGQCPSHTHFHCSRSRACVEHLQLCDLVDDCGDGSDEEDCSAELICDFEQGLCSWTQEQSHEGGDIFDWTLIQGPTPTLQTGPWKDHTLGHVNGHYLYIETSAPQEFKDTAMLVSPVLQPTLRHGNGMPGITTGPRHPCVFRFHYHMFGAHVFRLAVYMRTTKLGRGHML